MRGDIMEWKEEGHPRVGKGNGDKSGQFVPKGQGGREQPRRFRLNTSYDDILATDKETSINKIKQLKREETEADRIEQIQHYTGLSYKEAEKTYVAIKHYTRAGYKAIRDGSAPHEEQLIEEFIDRHPKYDGKIWRGIALSKKSGERFINNLKEIKTTGEATGMLGLSSWSSAENIANKFADYRKGEYKFIFELENKSGVGIDHLSEWQGENEVLQSGKVKYRVIDIVERNCKYKIRIEEVK